MQHIFIAFNEIETYLFMEFKILIFYESVSEDSILHFAMYNGNEDIIRLLYQHKRKNKAK